MGWRLQVNVRDSTRPRAVVRGLVAERFLSPLHLPACPFCVCLTSTCMPPALRPLQPVVGDWQQRVKHAKRQQRLDAAAAAAAAAVSGAEPAAAQATAAAAGSAAAAAAAGASRAGKPDLDALSEGLPSGWRAMWDATHARVYYGNIDTQASTGGRACVPPLHLLACRTPPPSQAARWAKADSAAESQLSYVGGAQVLRAS